jgi:secretion/DNA translocation related TadE-like protein
MTARDGDRGSAALWVVTGGLLILSVAAALMVRSGAVLARHRAETAADLSALAAAAGIGVDAATELMCARAVRVAAENSAAVTDCAVTLAPDGRSGSVRVTVTVTTRLLSVGVRTVTARARAGRIPFADDG